MTPEQFLAQIQRPSLPPACLFLGSESYQREVCRKALIERVLPPEEREHGLTRHDLEETSWNAVADDARSFSLFATHRLIWISSAESALPRARAGEEDDEGSGRGKGTSAEPLADYLKDPAPGVVLVLEASRYDFEGDEKTKIERVRKFYSFIPSQVEFRRFSSQQARRLAQDLARRSGLKIDSAAIDLLVEALGADALRIATEIEKLQLYAGPGRKIRAEEISELVSDASATTLFALVGALGVKDRDLSLKILDTLIRQGEYLPLALAFLATQFRLALVAKEAGLRDPQHIQAWFSKLGTPMWRSRAEQIYATASSFSKQQLESALKKIFSADRALRDARPDDRIVMEDFILRLTA